jgi:AcrR family transcriptional regulator
LPDRKEAVNIGKTGVKGPLLTNDRSPASVPEGSALLPGPLGTPGVGRLLEAATVAFAERGYHGVSVRDLTSTVGIQAGSFYAHFPSKEALLAELMVLGHQAHQAHVRDAILGSGADPVDQLRAAVHANVGFHATYPLLTIVCNSELHALAPETRDRIIALRHDAGVLVAAVIDRGNASGAFDCDDTWLALSAIAGMGVRVAWWYRPPSLRGDDSPLSDYPHEAATWLPESDHDVEAIASAYADFALRMVGAKA